MTCSETPMSRITRQRQKLNVFRSGLVGDRGVARQQALATNNAMSTNELL